MGREYINIPQKIYMRNFGDMLQKLDPLRSGTEATFCFEKKIFVTPEMLMLLVTLSKLSYDRVGRPVLWSGLSPENYSYLERLDVGNLRFVKLKKPEHALKYHRAIGGSDNLVELTEIENWKEIADAVKKTRSVVNRWFPEKPQQFRQNLITLIKETVENSCEHSGKHPQEGICYYAVQKYQQKNGDVELNIAVGDVGVGMLQSQRRVFPKTPDDVEAIRGALLDGRSGRKTGGGMGYLAIKEALGELDGEIIVRSGQGMIHYVSSKDQPRIYRKNTEYPGTQILFRCRG